MIKTITKVGNSHGIIFDATLMDMAHLKPGDEVNVEVHPGGSISLTPLKPRLSREQVAKTIKTTLKDYSRTMKRLA
jgi:antitoxin component of MazEF toxin-antitoxin module